MPDIIKYGLVSKLLRALCSLFITPPEITDLNYVMVVTKELNELTSLLHFFSPHPPGSQAPYFIFHSGFGKDERNLNFKFWFSAKKNLKGIFSVESECIHRKRIY